MIKLKVRRKIINVSEEDVLMDNGASIQMLTQEGGHGWDRYPLRMSKKLFNDLKKCGFLYTNEKLKVYAKEKYNDMVVLYKFNIASMVKAGYDVDETV